MAAESYRPDDEITAILKRWRKDYERTLADIAGIAAAAKPGYRVAPPLLPYHAVLLDTARAFMVRDECQVAVVMAQSAVEVLVEQIVTEQLRKRRTAPEVEEWVLARAKPFGLTGPNSLTLYIALTGDQIPRATFWDRYKRHVTRRHGVVHRGEKVTPQAAEQSLSVAEEMIRHIERRRR
jgi:hypothetical protein